MSISRGVATRIEEKKADYTKYGFTRVQSNAFKTFFDLAQEFEGIQDIYDISVGILKIFFNLDARLYIVDPKKENLVLVSATENKDDDPGTPLPDYIREAENPYQTHGSLILTIRGNQLLMEQVPFREADDVLGILQTYPVTSLDDHEALFFQKYANRIGFSLHMRFLLKKNIEHVKFIQSLVADIEHNVIVPNMVYRLFLRRLQGKILKNREIEESLSEIGEIAGSREQSLGTQLEGLLGELSEVNLGLMEEFQNIERHYETSSLFLETLLRRSHFDEGRLTLRTKACNMKKAVVLPQLEQFAGRFAEKGISINYEDSGMPEEETISLVDVGLMAQVYANLFSNVLKYAQEVVNDEGERVKYLTYGWERVKDYFGPGNDGIKYNVFSTGPPIPPEEGKNIFNEGYRGSAASGIPGTGHGLGFVKNAVEIHGGVTGYEVTPLGNNFYFIIPE
jgi:signal transduction histidine kinase